MSVIHGTRATNTFYVAVSVGLALWILVTGEFMSNAVNLFVWIPVVTVIVAFVFPPRPRYMVVATIAAQFLNLCFFDYVGYDSVNDVWRSGGWNDVWRSGGWTTIVGTIAGNSAIVGVVSWRMRPVWTTIRSRRAKLQGDEAHVFVTTGRTVRIAGKILVAIGVAWLLLGRFAEINAPFLILNWHIPAILLGCFLMYRGKQYVARSLPAELLDDTRPPVVYLRPFRKDASTAARVLPGVANPAILLTTFVTFEEQLAEAARPIGPLVALARPDKALPEPGAARFHATDEEWKDLVIELLNRARLVVVRPGPSDALLWELERAFEILSPSQLLLLFQGISRKEYNACSQSLQESFGVSLPEFVHGGAFVAFRDAWKPHPLPLRAPYLRQSRYKPWRRLVHHALEPVFRDLGVDWHPSPISALTVSAFIVLALSLFGDANRILVLPHFW